MSKYRPEVSDYTVFTAGDPLRLEQEVREAMNDGWQPLGGAFFAQEPGANAFGQTTYHPVWCQTMVQRKLARTDLPKREETKPTTKEEEMNIAWKAQLQKQ